MRRRDRMAGATTPPGRLPYIPSKRCSFGSGIHESIELLQTRYMIMLHQSHGTAVYFTPVTSLVPHLFPCFSSLPQLSISRPPQCGISYCRWYCMQGIWTDKPADLFACLTSQSPNLEINLKTSCRLLGSCEASSACHICVMPQAQR